MTIFTILLKHKPMHYSDFPTLHVVPKNTDGKITVKWLYCINHVTLLQKTACSMSLLLKDQYNIHSMDLFMHL